MNYTFLVWQEGLRVLFVDDAKGAHGSRGGGCTDNPVYTVSGSAGSAGAGGYTWQIDTRDGKSADFKLNGTEYDPTQVALFVVKTKGDQVEVHQLSRDLSAVPLDADGCREALEKDAEVRQLLGLGELPK
jgi:hypothetical protein